ncbi:hypothetical protein [Peterkaempfera sp. SMS 1(5)a]|uniref:hypothetical protein n=1 Tax=Peterkaempfera podocarpi TaxID=3232308 RepID=UPI0036733084
MVGAALAFSCVLGAAAPADAGQVAEVAAAHATSDFCWKEDVLPATGTTVDDLAFPAAGTVWAAGTQATLEGKGIRFTPALFARGRSSAGWSGVALDPVTVNSRVNALDARSPFDGILVGDYAEDLGGVLTQHMVDGAWRVAVAEVPANTLGGGLLDVDMTPSGSAWAVGWAQIEDSVTPDPDGGLPTSTYHNEPLVQRWDGATWQRWDLPRIAESWYLNGVTALAPDDVWAVGQTEDTLQPVVMHYDGTSWRHVPTPSYGGVQGELLRVTARGGELWAVGSLKRDVDGAIEGLVLRLDGTMWRQVPLPPGTGRLTSVAATPGEVAVVGTENDGSYGFAFDGSSWRPLRLPGPDQEALSLTTVAADAAGTLFVGGVRPGTETTPSLPVVLGPCG